ncbi:MAG: G-D-S-L family lipolytic protein [Cyanobacteria bacterium J083]|nr:MAG: G-D-S-L family lipolytic protein [Cyanobacteria bacterium J083]
MPTVSNPQGTKLVNNHSVPLKIVALGDSLIYGYGDPSGGGWVERLRRQWMSPQSPGHVIYNLGIRGNTVAQVSQRLEYEFSQRGELRNRLPDLIILSVGVNDSPRLGRPDGRPYTPLEKFKVQVADLLEQAKQLCPVLFVGTVPINESKMPFLDCFYYNRLAQFTYKEVTKLACQQRQIPYLDIFDLWLSRGEEWLQSQLAEDGLHPNVSGYQTLVADVTNWHYIKVL